MNLNETERAASSAERSLWLAGSYDACFSFFTTMMERASKEVESANPLLHDRLKQGQLTQAIAAMGLHGITMELLLKTLLVYEGKGGKELRDASHSLIKCWQGLSKETRDDLLSYTKKEAFPINVKRSQHGKEQVKSYDLEKYLKFLDEMKWHKLRYDFWDRDMLDETTAAISFDDMVKIGTIHKRLFRYVQKKHDVQLQGVEYIWLAARDRPNAS